MRTAATGNAPRISTAGTGATTKEESLAHAKDIAEDWYLGLRGKARAGILKTGKTFADAAKGFLDEYVTLIKDERNPQYVASYEEKIRA